MLREAIREYEANKWKTIGQKVGKPAKVADPWTRFFLVGLFMADLWRRRVSTTRESISGVRDP